MAKLLWQLPFSEQEPLRLEQWPSRCICSCGSALVRRDGSRSPLASRRSSGRSSRKCRSGCRRRQRRRRRSAASSGRFALLHKGRARGRPARLRLPPPRHPCPSPRSETWHTGPDGARLSFAERGAQRQRSVPGHTRVTLEWARTRSAILDASHERPARGREREAPSPASRGCLSCLSPSSLQTDTARLPDTAC